jgi:hypothetical protein
VGTGWLGTSAGSLAAVPGEQLTAPFAWADNKRAPHEKSREGSLFRRAEEPFRRKEAKNRWAPLRSRNPCRRLMLTLNPGPRIAGDVNAPKLSRFLLVADHPDRTAEVPQFGAEGSVFRRRDNVGRPPNPRLQIVLNRVADS